MDEIARRAHLRVACDRAVEVLDGAAQGRRLGAGRVLNLSLAGALIAYGRDLRQRAPYRLRVPGPKGGLELPFRLAREAPRGRRYAQLRHFGLVFNLTSDQEAALRAFLDEIRAQPTPDEDTLLDRLLRTYWSR